MKFGWLVFVLVGLLALSGCDSDDGEETDTDAGVDTSMDVAADVPADEDAEPELPGGFGTVSATVLWNLGPVPDGSLTVALYTTNTPTGTGDFEQVIDPVDMLPTTIAFEDVPVGPGYYVVAFLDVDRDSSIEAPGAGDYLAVTMDPVGIESNGAMVSASVELR